MPGGERRNSIDIEDIEDRRTKVKITILFKIEHKFDTFFVSARYPKNKM